MRFQGELFCSMPVPEHHIRYCIQIKGDILKIRSVKKDELEKLTRFIINSMSGYEDKVRGTRAYMELKPLHRVEQHIIAVDDDGTWLSHVEMEDRLFMRIGKAMVRTALVSDVGTPPEFRNRGLATKTMVQSAVWAQKTGYKLITLSSAPDPAMHLYKKLGYVQFCDETHVEIRIPRLISLIRQKFSYTVKRYSNSFLKEMGDMYRATFGNVTGTIVRSSGYWRRIMDSKQKMCGVVNKLDPDFIFVAFKDNIAVAYMIGTSGTYHIPEKGTCIIWEAAHKQGYIESYYALFCACGRIMMRKGLEKLRIASRVDHPIFQMAREIGGTGHFDVHRHDLALIPDYAGFLEAIIPALKNRIDTSHHKGTQNRLSIGRGKNCFTISFNGNDIVITRGKSKNHISCSDGPMIQILIGYKSAKDAIGLQEAEVSSGKTAELAGILFPNEHPWQSHLDA